MNKQSVIGLILIFGIFIGYMWWVTPSKEEQARMRAEHDSMVAAYMDSVAAVEAQKEARHKADSLAAIGDSSVLDSLKLTKRANFGSFSASTIGDSITVTLQNSLMQVSLCNIGARVDNVILNEYTTFDSMPLQLITPSHDNLNLTLATEDNHIVETRDLVFRTFVNGTPVNGATPTIQLDDGDSAVVSFFAYVSSDSNGFDYNRSIEFRYTLHGSSYNVGYELLFHNLDGIVRDYDYLDLTWHNSMNRQEKVDRSSKNSKNPNKDIERQNSSIYYKPTNDNVDYLKQGRDDDEKVKTAVEWIAYKQQFFCAILMSDSAFTNADCQTSTDATNDNPNYLCDMHSTIGLDYHGGNSIIPMQFYFGPTRYHDLRAMHKGFERMLPLGWGFFLTQWISRYAIIPVFNFLEQFDWNYGIIVIILTVLLRLILFPLTFKSYQGSAIMKILKPEMDLLNKKYPKPEQAMQKQQEMSKLQKKAGYNPLSGCLPLLIQLPIIWAMFRFYPASIELRQKPFLWCDDLSTYDSILNLNFNIPLYGDHVSLFCLLMFGVQFFYTWYTMKATAGQAQMPGMKFMMYFMPFMMLFLFNSQSAALNLYYFCSLSITMLQMILIRKFTSEKKVRARMAAYDIKNSNKPQKKSNFQKRMEQMMKEAEAAQKQRR
ncbi:MAG: membrane protein insertase YidC [Bacteroidales bacterium]|nr:membrane protein insertase YidC [Candidatus Colimorpha onthohippi]